MRKTHYIPVTADVPGAASDANCALIRRTIRTALAAEGVTAPCEVDVLLTDDEGIHRIKAWMAVNSRFFIAFQGVITQLVMNHIHVEVIVVRWDSVQVGLDVVEIKPYHKSLT